MSLTLFDLGAWQQARLDEVELALLQSLASRQVQTQHLLSDIEYNQPVEHK